MSVFRPGLFAGKVALVSGGGSGIGKAISKELLTLGCRVAIASRSEERLVKAAQELSEVGEVKYFQCNIKDEENVKSTIASTIDSLGHIDFLVNNGGGQFPQTADKMKLKAWNAVIETNLTGTFLMSREAYNQSFSKRKQGSIVNIIVDFYKGLAMFSHTGAARAGVENLTKSLAVEWASQGVRVNAVCPGMTYSKTASENYGEFKMFETRRPDIPFKRFGTVDEISSTVCFLLSPGGSYCTGSTFLVDGGEYLNAPQYIPLPEHKSQPPYAWTGAELPPEHM